MTVLFSFKYIFIGHWGNDGKGKWSFLLTLNGVLTGIVAVCAGCNQYALWGALIVGSFGGMAYVAIHMLMEKCKLDDPLDAVAVHLGGGELFLFLISFLSYAFFMHTIIFSTKIHYLYRNHRCCNGTFLFIA